ncbi:MAG: hypothetical protein NT033_05640 [Candidatus Omnitrophica bacterium]|nr:hypothetical protein [Candidatus Omnitrophota bacterium]
MPEKKEIFAGLQSHIIYNKDLEGESGKLRSTQEFFLLSYGVYDWLSLDLKGGLGNIQKHSSVSEDIDYPTYLAGGYGFRVRLYQANNKKAVFGFQHISVHPKTVSVEGSKNKVVLDDWQFSLLGSYDFKKITPYLGVRWSRVGYIHWKDKDRQLVKSDLTKDVGLILGFDLPVTEKIWVNLEGGLVDGEAASLSINYRF